AVALFSLTAAAESYRKLYDNFLQQHTVSIQQQTFPVTEARQTSAASVLKTSPKPVLVWLVTILAGGLLAAWVCGCRALVWTGGGGGNLGPRVPDQGPDMVGSRDRVSRAGSAAT